MNTPNNRTPISPETQTAVQYAIGQMATDKAYRSDFFQQVEQILQEHEASANFSTTQTTDEMILRRMAKCPLTRLGTSLVLMAYQKHQKETKQQIALQASETA